MKKPPFRLTPYQVQWLLVVGFVTVGYALYLRYLAIEFSAVALACDAGLPTMLCKTRILVTSLFRNGRVCAAQILAELGDDRGRFVSAEHLAAEGGVAPITRESGKHRAVGFRWACNKRLRAALTCLADASRHTSPWAAALYQRAKARGCDHPHAMRIVARAWCRVLWACWQKRVAYDPGKHAAALKFAPRIVGKEAA